MIRSPKRRTGLRAAMLVGPLLVAIAFPAVSAGAATTSTAGPTATTSGIPIPSDICLTLLGQRYCINL
jgi:hypothetical protein